MAPNLERFQVCICHIAFLFCSLWCIAFLAAPASRNAADTLTAKRGIKVVVLGPDGLVQGVWAYEQLRSSSYVLLLAPCGQRCPGQPWRDLVVFVMCRCLRWLTTRPSDIYCWSGEPVNAGCVSECPDAFVVKAGLHLEIWDVPSGALHSASEGWKPSSGDGFGLQHEIAHMGFMASGRAKPDSTSMADNCVGNASTTSTTSDWCEKRKVKKNRPKERKPLNLKQLMKP